MASPLLERVGDDPSIDVEVVPGVTAAVAAAALLGAPLGHDHCAISLSDLLTPWEVIHQRITAAAEGDFVVCFYNPRSRSRHWQLDAACALLAGHRKPDTPVGIVRDAFRPTQSVTVTTLGDLDTRTVDMVTIVVVGSSQTTTLAGRMVTPRGYRRDP
jgi:cobalt-precorrin 5A hydrolase/precorrin-3B C17-methyltransferase